MAETTGPPKWLLRVFAERGRKVLDVELDEQPCRTLIWDIAVDDREPIIAPRPGLAKETVIVHERTGERISLGSSLLGYIQTDTRQGNSSVRYTLEKVA